MDTIEDARGTVDYTEAGTGPTVVLVPGSCSTGAAWRPVIARLGEDYRIVTTSLAGYGGSDERRTAADRTIAPVADALEAVIERANSPVHLVGHSFGGLVALAVALGGRMLISSLTILEAPAPGFLDPASTDHAAFRSMTDAYAADFQAGNAEAIGAMIDFYGGAGTYASWPPPVRAYAARTTATNLLDWESAYAFAPTSETLNVPTLVVAGANSHPAVIHANQAVAAGIPGAQFVLLPDAAHFMIATHADDVTTIVTQQIARGGGL